MSESTKVWQVLKRNVQNFWMRIEVASFAGFPDTIVLAPDGMVFLVELKYLREWPKRATTTTKLNVSGLQKHFMEQWINRGGRAYLIARVGDDWLLLCGDQLGDFTREEWRSRAIYHTRGEMPDFVLLEKLL